ncbi:hypothetical protein [Dysgonomonas macrotermitis]|uniref:Endo-acting ulvan lyase C-terminal domain-containing protein n=1 Tax=Dysgonomonas macrotermitis TaxID=1346286 RepID=A0A1M5JJX5_9BACT|nr:hypothetical protein [Dysgonomonas macrotermitis]SHG40872.1 hypothetical protein SAMN05444362_1259 [Dysgonomonas macrotermitis]
MKKIILTFLIFLPFVCYSKDSKSHPCLYVSNDDKSVIIKKIQNEEWAGKVWQRIRGGIDVYVDRHQNDPQWILSRIAMYWKEGERFTQCYLKNEVWDYGTGNAPVPTLRLPGMRKWNDYNNVPLDERIPYNETGDMMGLSRSNPTAKPVLVPYKESGHMIRGNNKEILSLAEKAAFVYWITGEDKYAEFASDIYWKCILGIYYMNPPLDPEKSSKGVGGYEPGGILGYYDYEQIHDDLQVYLTGIYDLLFDYLVEHPDRQSSVIGKDVVSISSEVFKRFIDIGLVRGGRTGNWNVNGFDLILRSMLVLENNTYYADGKGMDYYLPFYTTNTTEYHDALPDILKVYDPVTGLWPEAPGYASGTIGSLVNLALPIYRSGINTIADYPMIQKAALANLNWLDVRGNLVVFGDMRGGPLSYNTFERLLTYYTWVNDLENAKKVASIIRKGIDSGQYSRTQTDWVGLCLNQPLPETDSTMLPYNRVVYSPVHRHLIMKNRNDEQNGLMFTLYGGENGKHLSPNGLAMQLYGKGWALAPDAAAYESYWSKDAKYHQSATGSNTILPGYTAGEIVVNAMDPFVASDEFTNKNTISESYSFADVSADEKRRLVAMVRTSPITGYYIDIFRSDQPNNDYLYHNLGNEMKLYDIKGNRIQQEESVNDLDTVYNAAYSYFANIKKSMHTGDFRAVWDITTVFPAIKMEMWMIGQKNRTIYTMDAPPTTLLNNITPGDVNKSPQPTPSLIVRQNNNNAKDNPFIGVFEPYNEGQRSVQKVSEMAAQGDFISLLVESKDSRQYICSSINEKTHSPIKGISFKGIFGIVSVNKKGFEALYLGKGYTISYGKYIIESLSGDASAELRADNGIYYYSSDKPVKITINNKVQEMPAGYNVKLSGF